MAEWELAQESVGDNRSGAIHCVDDDRIDRCDNCGSMMREERQHLKCDNCGHIVPCCEGSPV